MAKTKETIELEKLLWSHTNKLGTYGAFEVKIGFHKTSKFIQNREEYVDYMTYSTDGIIRCYEIKTSKSDTKSKANLSFLGNYNYFVMPEDLYHEIKNEAWFKDKTFNGAVGVIVLNNYGKLSTIKNAKKNTTSLGMQTFLVESMVRSLSRDANKYYNIKYKESTM